MWRYTHNAHSEADSLAVVLCSAMLMKLSHSTFSPRIYILHSLQPSTAGVLLHSVLFCVIRLICIQSTVIRSRLNASRYARCSRSRLVLIFIDLIRMWFRVQSHPGNPGKPGIVLRLCCPGSLDFVLEFLVCSKTVFFNSINSTDW